MNRCRRTAEARQQRARQCRCLTLTPRELSLLKRLVRCGRISGLWQRWGWLLPARTSRSLINFTSAPVSFVTVDEDLMEVFFHGRCTLQFICHFAGINAEHIPLKNTTSVTCHMEKSSGDCNNKQLNKLSRCNDGLVLWSGTHCLDNDRPWSNWLVKTWTCCRGDSRVVQLTAAN